MITGDVTLVRLRMIRLIFVGRWVINLTFLVAIGNAQTKVVTRCLAFFFLASFWSFLFRLPWQCGWVGDEQIAREIVMGIF